MNYSTASEVLSLHAPIEADCCVSACLSCGSIVMAAAPEDVDGIRAVYDTSCCSAEATVYP